MFGWQDGSSTALAPAAMHILVFVLAGKPMGRGCPRQFSGDWTACWRAVVTAKGFVGAVTKQDSGARGSTFSAFKKAAQAQLAKYVPAGSCAGKEELLRGWNIYKAHTATDSGATGVKRRRQDALTAQRPVQVAPS